MNTTLLILQFQYKKWKKNSKIGLKNRGDILARARVKVIKRDGGTGDNDTRLFSRRAVGYKPWKYPDQKAGGVNKVMEDEFSCKLPEPFYSEWYKPTRETYAKAAKVAIKAELIRRRKAKQKKLDREAKKKGGRPRKT